MDQAETLRRLAAQKPKVAEPKADQDIRIIAVTSGKGGVGKSNVTLNTAIALAKRGHATLILDADMGTANIDILLGMDPRLNLGHVIEGKASLFEILVKISDNLYLLPGASGIMDPGYLGIQNLEQLRKDIGQLESMFQYVFIDTAAGVNQMVIQALKGSDRVLLICNDEPTSIVDAYALVKVLYKQDPEAFIQLVVNDVAGEEEAEDVYGKLRAAIQHFLKRDLDYLNHIAHDDVIARGVILQKPFMFTAAESPARGHVEALAEKLESTLADRGGKGLLQLFQRLIQP
ncbi:MinD/ParA family protein [Acanthopleuribacter pedis]|uniref:MinD/ParA family protein n=1 Tax=Acanthopleuribacter pedis TaxID=442870 RepID=A0A8J7QER7_9BACT|nr:MinD/ParA family protein [Acanthopleuribacter pedis]MBO1322929.1 MinD/ParA family protein [Acanthopleuribacter pedis]